MIQKIFHLNNKSFKAFIGTVVAILILAFYNHQIADYPVDLTPQMSATSKQHILYGDARGGGHKFGTGKPCKSEFPQDWSEFEIIETVERIAANDNLPWRMEDNGYAVVEQSVEGLKVRLVIDPDEARIVTAYPTNVTRNPCPARTPANDL